MKFKQISIVATVGLALAVSAWANALPSPHTSIQLKASAIGCSQVDLQWSDNAADKTGFLIERSGGLSGSWTVIGTTGPNDRTFPDVGLSPFTTYYYQVRAYSAAGPSEASNIVKVKTKRVPPDVYGPSVPMNVTASTGSACNSIAISWTASTDIGRSGLKGYTVYVSEGLPLEVAAPATSIDVISLELLPSISYSFAVTATDYAGNESPRSEIAWASPRSTCSGSGGTTLSATAFPGDMPGSRAVSLALDAQDSTVIAVEQYGSIDYGGATLTTGGGADISIVKFGDDGRPQWARIFGGSGDQVPSGMAIDALGDIYVTGFFEDRLEFDNHCSISRLACVSNVDCPTGQTCSVDTLISHGPNPDIFLVKLAGNGEERWAQRFGSEGYDKGYALAVDPWGGVVVTGYFTGTVDFGGRSFDAHGADIFVVRFDGDGMRTWSRAMGGPGADYAHAIAMDGTTGNLSITGSFEGTVDFRGEGEGTITGADGATDPLISSWGSKDIFVASYSGLDGHWLWSRGFGSADDDGGRAIAVDNDGNVVTMGLFSDPPPRRGVDFGNGIILSTTDGWPEIYLAKFDAAHGATLWSRGGGSGDPPGDSALAIDQFDDVLTSVTSSAPVDLGGGRLTAPFEDVVVAKLLRGGQHVWSRRFETLSGRQNSGALAARANGNIVLAGQIEGTADYGAAVITADGPILLVLAP